MGGRHSGENALRRLPSMPWSPIGKNILFDRESAPALAMKAGMRALSACFCRSKFETMASGSNHAMRPYAIRGNRRRRQAWPCFSLVVNVQSTFFVTFCQFRRKLVRHRVTRRTRNQTFFFFFFFFVLHVDKRACASSGQAQSPLIDVSTIVASSSTRTFPFVSLAGLVQRLTSCFKLYFFIVAELSESSNRARKMSGKGVSADALLRSLPSFFLFLFFLFSLVGVFLYLQRFIVRVWFELLLLGQHRLSLGCCKAAWTQIMQAKSFQRPFTAGFSSVLELNCLTVFVSL